MKDSIYKETMWLCIWTKTEYAMFISIINKPDKKRRVYRRLDNLKEDNEDDEKDFLA